MFNSICVFVKSVYPICTHNLIFVPSLISTSPTMHSPLNGTSADRMTKCVFFDNCKTNTYVSTHKVIRAVCILYIT